MSGYRLIYFPVKGRGEPIRYLLVDNDIPYTEENCRDGWADKWKPKMPFGQVPCLYDGDFQIVQSNAILRYLGRKHDLYGSNAQEAGKVDMISDAVEELRTGYTTMIYRNYENGKDPFIKEIKSKWQPIENILKASSGEIIAGKMTFLDYNLFDLIDVHLVLSPSCMDELPTLKLYHQRLSQRPKLKAFRDTAEFKARPINGNNKQ